MIVSILIDGELRLYEADRGKLDEWGRLRMQDAMTHEDVARFSLDLAELLKVNGAAATTGIGVRIATPPSAPPSAPPKALPSGPRRLPANANAQQVLRVLRQHGPTSIGELSRITGLDTGVLSMRLGSLRKSGFVRNEDGAWRPLADDEPRSGRGHHAQARQTGNQYDSAAFLQFVRQHPGLTRAQIAQQTGLQRITINNRLHYLGPKSDSSTGYRDAVRIDDEGRVWPNTDKVEGTATVEGAA